MGYLEKTKILFKSKYRLKTYIIANYIVTIVYCEIMFLNDNQDFYVYLYWGKRQMGHICPMLANQYQIIFSF